MAPYHGRNWNGPSRNDGNSRNSNHRNNRSHINSGGKPQSRNNHNNNNNNGNYNNNSGNYNNNSNFNKSNNNRTNNSYHDSNSNNDYNNSNGNRNRNNGNKHNNNRKDGFREGRQIEALTQDGLYQVRQTHLHVLRQGDMLMNAFNTMHNLWREGLRPDGRGHQEGFGLWDALERVVGNRIDRNFCYFLHPAGIRYDDEGDAFMEEASMCECLSGDYSVGRIPRCFLRAFFYMIAANEFRKQPPPPPEVNREQGASRNEGIM